MADLAAFFSQLSGTPLFGLTVTVGAYVIAMAIYHRLKTNP